MLVLSRYFQIGIPSFFDRLQFVFLVATLVLANDTSLLLTAMLMASSSVKLVFICATAEDIPLRKSQRVLFD
jgi:hypothetical protein